VSVLTKVLVTVLAVASVALSMLVVAALAQQQNWKASAEDWQVAATNAQAKERAVAEFAALEKARALDQRKLDQQTIKKLQADLAASGADNAECQRRFAEAQSKLTIEQGQVTSSQEQSQLVFAALNREKEFSAKLARRNSELERGNIDLTDRVKELTTNVEMARAQVRALQQQIAAMDVRGGSMGAGPATQIPGGDAIVEAGVPSVSAPAMPMVTAPIRAEVTEVMGNLASISVGSADGVAHGMEFLIYRRGGEHGRPQFLGTLRITRVEANKSAGNIEHSEGDIRAGDLARDEASFAMRG